MHKAKIITILIILISTVFSFSFTASAASRFDIIDTPINRPDHAAIVRLQQTGIISGYADHTFRPDKPVNRAEALKMILKGSGINVPTGSGMDNFTDTDSNAWYSDFILIALSMEIIDGYPDKTFRPNQTINLVETMKILLQANNTDLSNIKNTSNPYQDTISGQWYIKYLQYGKDNKLIDPDMRNNIHPNLQMTRGRLAELIYRMIKLHEGLMPAQKLRAEQLISLFENGTTEIQYGFVKKLNDGRGITAGRAGFTTATGDAYEVVKRYAAKHPTTPLASYLPELKKLASARSDDTGNLSGFENAWEKAAQDQLFRDTQDEVVNEFYFYPAMRHADDLGLIFPLSRALIYDTIIQHGDGEDPDGLPALIRRTNTAAEGSPLTGLDEKEWIKTFLRIRREDLSNSYDESTRAGWAVSVSRCDVFSLIMKDNNYLLEGPIVINTINYQGTTD